MIVEFEGQRYEFPDDATDDEIAQVLGGTTNPKQPLPKSNRHPIQIQAPDGAIVEFPDGTDDETITRVMRENYGGPSDSGQPTKTRSTLPELEDALRNADAAGDVDAARQLADEIVRQRAAASTRSPQTVPAMLQGMRQRAFAQPQADSATAVQWDRAQDIQYAWQGGARNFADVLGTPVDLAAGGLNLVQSIGDSVAHLFGHETAGARIRNPIFGSDWIADKASRVYEAAGGTVVDRDDVSPQARMTHDINRFGSGAVLGAGALASKGGQAAAGMLREAASGSAAPALTRAAERVVSPLAAPYAGGAAPMWGDAAAGAGSGLASAAYEEDAPDDLKDAVGPFGQIAAALAGGVGGATAQSVAAGTLKGSRNAAETIVFGSGDRHAPTNPVTGRRYTRAEMDDAARSVQSQASNPLAAANQIERSQNDLATVAHPVAMPTAGAMSEDVGLTLLEKEARSRRPKEFAERDRSTATQAAEIVRGMAPADANPRDFTDAIGQQFANRERQAAANVEAARLADADFATVRRQSAAPVQAAAGTGTAASQKLDSAIVGGSLHPMQSRKNEAFAAIDPNRTVARDAQPLIDAANGIRERLGRLNDPSSVLPLRTLDRIDRLAVDAGGDGTISFAEINSLRPELSSALTKARATGDFALADNIQALQSAIGRETDRLAAEGTEAGRRAAIAQKTYRDEFAPVWAVGPGDEATRFRKDVNADRAARSLSPPSDTAGRFLRPASPEKAASLRRIIETLPDRQAATKEARDFLISDLAESGAIDAAAGSLRPDVLRRWLNKWGPTVDEVPGVRAEVEQLLATADSQSMTSGRLAHAVREAEARLDEATRNRGAAGFVLGKDPMNAAAAIFRANDPEKAMAALRSAVDGNPRASDGMKAAVTDFIVRQTSKPNLADTADGARPIDFGQLENLFNRHQRTLAQLYSPEEMNSLRQVHKMLQPGHALKGAAASGSVHEVQKAEQAWRLLEGGLKARFGVLKGGGVLRTIRVMLEALPNRHSAVEDLIVRMHFDPQLAMHLLRRDADAFGPAWNRKLNTLLATATGARESTEDRAD